jgi:hypothetical protein
VEAAKNQGVRGVWSPSTAPGIRHTEKVSHSLRGGYGGNRECGGSLIIPNKHTCNEQAAVERTGFPDHMAGLALMRP